MIWYPSTRSTSSSGSSSPSSSRRRSPASRHSRRSSGICATQLSAPRPSPAADSRRMLASRPARQALSTTASRPWRDTACASSAMCTPSTAPTAACFRLAGSCAPEDSSTRRRPARQQGHPKTVRQQQQAAEPASPPLSGHAPTPGNLHRQPAPSSPRCQLLPGSLEPGAPPRGAPPGPHPSQGPAPARTCQTRWCAWRAAPAALGAAG